LKVRNGETGKRRKRKRRNEELKKRREKMRSEESLSPGGVLNLPEGTALVLSVK
jgi:hypothetical protein